MGTAALLTIAAVSASSAPPTAGAPADCSRPPAHAVRSAAAAPQAAASRLQVAPRLGSNGQYLGRRISVSPAAAPPFDVTLPAESSVAGITGEAALYTLVVRGRSEVHALDLRSGCDHVLLRPRGIVRSALLAPDGSAIFIHGVSGSGRADQGVTRYPLDGSTPARVLGPIELDERFGPTFGTELSWGGDGSTLVVQSCGLEACRTRLVDLASGATQMLGSRHGTVLGVTPSHVIAFEACHWLPCGVLSMERSTGATETLAHEAWSAAVVTRQGGRQLVQIQTADQVLEVAP